MGHAALMLPGANEHASNDFDAFSRHAAPVRVTFGAKLLSALRPHEGFADVRRREIMWAHSYGALQPYNWRARTTFCRSIMLEYPRVWS